MSEPARAVLAACAAGTISPEVALGRLLLEGATPERIIALLTGAEAKPLLRMRAMVEERHASLSGIAAQLARGAGDHAALAAACDPSAVATFFDRAVAWSPEASVALYSLADPAILEAATAEIVLWLRSAGLLGGDVLDLGCGIGRVAAALAPECRSVLGLDVSRGMVAVAVARHRLLRHLSFAVTDGRDLDLLATSSIDLALAVDSFPYIVQLGETCAATHMAGLARALRPGGSLVILNLSYRGDDEKDRADAARWASSTGLVLVTACERPFRVWDGAVYRFDACRD